MPSHHYWLSCIKITVKIYKYIHLNIQIKWPTLTIPAIQKSPSLSPADTPNSLKDVPHLGGQFCWSCTQIEKTRSFFGCSLGVCCWYCQLVMSDFLQPHGLQPGSSVHGILKATVLELVTIPLPRGSSWPRDQTLVSYIVGRFFTIQATKENPDIDRVVMNTASLLTELSFLS